MYDFILATLLMFPAFWGDRDETPGDRQARVELVARAIDEAVRTTPWPGSKREQAAVLAVKAVRESGGLARHIHASKCRLEIGECDRGRAVSLWQLHVSKQLPPEQWERLKGDDLEATTRAAKAAARALLSARRACGDLRGAISLYATGSTCDWSGADARVQDVNRALKKNARRSQ